jgi:hypothetical protein
MKRAKPQTHKIVARVRLHNRGLPVSPLPVRIDAQRVLVYELHITNFDVVPLALTRVEVFRSELGTTPLIALSDKSLEVAMIRVGSRSESAATKDTRSTKMRTIAAGVGTVVYWWAFGEPVLAVADGEITDADGIPDNVPRNLPPVTLDNIAGNHKTLQISPTRYVTYAHLQDGKPQGEVARPGSLGNGACTLRKQLKHHGRICTCRSRIGTQYCSRRGRLSCFRVLYTSGREPITKSTSK